MGIPRPFEDFASLLFFPSPHLLCSSRSRSLLFSSNLLAEYFLGCRLLSFSSTFTSRCWSTLSTTPTTIPQSNLPITYHRTTFITNNLTPPRPILQNGRQPLRPHSRRHIQSRAQPRRLRHPSDPPAHPLGRRHLRDVHDPGDVHAGRSVEGPERRQESECGERDCRSGDE